MQMIQRQLPHLQTTSKKLYDAVAIASEQLGLHINNKGDKVHGNFKIISPTYLSIETRRSRNITSLRIQLFRSPYHFRCLM